MCSFCSFKCWFTFFNVLFLASGVALITIGALQYSTYSQIGTFAGSSLSKIAIVLIAVGVAISLISFLGHVGAFLNNSSMVACFVCILIVIIMLEIFTGAAFYIIRSRTILIQVGGQLNNGINDKAHKVIHAYNMEDRHTIDRIQEKFHCCGADGFSDWFTSEGWGNHDAVPDSCCLVKSQGCGQDKANIQTKGCAWMIKIFLLKNLVWVGAVCIALGITEILGVITGLCLCVKLKYYDKIE